MKGQVSIIEAIVASIALFIAFNMIINTGVYQTNWKEAVGSMNGRDVLVTADRLGKLYDYSFSLSAFNSEFISKLDSVNDSIIRLDAVGTPGNVAYVACDCTNDQMNYVQGILNSVKFNNRQISFTVCSTALPAINTCGSGAKYPNALVIWGYKDLTPQDTMNNLTDFINNNNGIIEIADIPNAKVDGIGTDDDVAQKLIFGLKSTSDTFPSITQDNFLTPQDAYQAAYQAYKAFYHLPYTATATGKGNSFKMEGGQQITCNGNTGNFNIQNNNFQFWICSDGKAYFDTSIPQNNKADIVISQGQSFLIGSSNFTMNYIDTPDKIRVSFKPAYPFNDFVVADESHNKLLPIDDDKGKGLLSMGFWDINLQKPISAVIFNGTDSGKTAWVADFSRTGLANTGDDHRQLLSSLIFSVMNKNQKQKFQQIGQVTSYINVNNTDILDIYRIDLSVGKPF